VADDAAEELAVGPCPDHDLGHGLVEVVAHLLVGGVVVLAAQPVVPDPRRMRDGGVDLDLGVGGVRATGHDGHLPTASSAMRLEPDEARIRRRPSLALLGSGAAQV
jgi:hypothetical protein